ncbi:hypothetical protein FG379_002205 [Cryptosporidium bovis]|uniref:uncharacterized protein n=1 Tax=Cryptosporidium bovis TaxID=310047 RepID=UPI00351A085D|nr:hypothetical protein FG379_002205 [Cryptosporidium bovis]
MIINAIIKFKKCNMIQILIYYFIYNLIIEKFACNEVEYVYNKDKYKNNNRLDYSKNKNSTSELYLRDLYSIENDLSNISGEQLSKDLENLNYVSRIVNPLEFLHEELFITNIKNDSMDNDSLTIDDSNTISIKSLNKRNNVNSTRLGDHINSQVRINDNTFITTNITTTTTTTTVPSDFNVESSMDNFTTETTNNKVVAYSISSNSDINKHSLNLNNNNNNIYDDKIENKINDNDNTEPENINIEGNRFTDISLNSNKDDSFLVMTSYNNDNLPETTNEVYNATGINSSIRSSSINTTSEGLMNNSNTINSIVGTTTTTATTTTTTIVTTTTTATTTTTTATTTTTIATTTTTTIATTTKTTIITNTNTNATTATTTTSSVGTEVTIPSKTVTKVSTTSVPSNVIDYNDSNNSSLPILTNEINDSNTDINNLYEYYEELINDDTINGIDSFYTLDNPLKKVEKIRPNSGFQIKGINNSSNLIKDDKLLSKIPLLSTKPPNSSKIKEEVPFNTTSTTTVATNTESKSEDNNLAKTIIDGVHNSIKVPSINPNKELNNKNIKIIETITLSLLDSSYCKERTNNFRRISFLLKENIAKILSIHIHDVVIDDVYSESSNGFNIMSEKCTFSNGKLKGIIFDLSIIKNKLTDYPKYDDIVKITEVETKFNKEYGKILIWKREITNLHNKNNPFCQASLKESNNIKLSCINHPINCIHNNEYKCYTNPMGIDCYCYNELFYDKNNLSHEEKALKYGYKDGDNRVIIMENKINNKNINQFDDNLNDLEITKECRAIILCTSDITTPIIQRCSSSPYSIGCPCSLNPYSKLCGCYINPFNPGCHCTYNKNSSDCKCLLKPEECRTENEPQIGQEVVSRSPFDLKNGIRRFYRKHFRKSSSQELFNKYSYYITIFVLYLLLTII